MRYKFNDFGTLMRNLFPFICSCYSNISSQSYSNGDILFCSPTTNFREWFKKTKKFEPQDNAKKQKFKLFFIVAPEYLSEDQKRFVDDINQDGIVCRYFILSISNNVSYKEMPKNINLGEMYQKLIDKVHVVNILVPGTNALQILQNLNYQVYDVFSIEGLFPKLNPEAEYHYIRIHPNLIFYPSLFFAELFTLVFLAHTEKFAPNKLNEHQKIYLEFPYLRTMNPDHFPFPINPQNFHVIKPEEYTDDQLNKFEDPRFNNASNLAYKFPEDQYVKISIENDFPELKILLNNINCSSDNIDSWDIIEISQKVPKKIKNSPKQTDKQLDAVGNQRFNNIMKKLPDNFNELNILGKVNKIYQIFFNTNNELLLSIIQLHSINKYIKHYSHWITDFLQSLDFTQKENVRVLLNRILLESAIIFCTKFDFQTHFWNLTFILPENIFVANGSKSFSIFIYEDKQIWKVHPSINTNGDQQNTDFKLKKQLIPINEFNISSIFDAINNDSEKKQYFINHNFEANKMKYKNVDNLNYDKSIYCSYSFSPPLFIRVCLIFSRIGAGISYCLYGGTGCGKTSIHEILATFLELDDNDLFVV